jgi:tetratricopeptide (TPR) repeat protein
MVREGFSLRFLGPTIETFWRRLLGLPRKLVRRPGKETVVHGPGTRWRSRGWRRIVECVAVFTASLVGLTSAAQNEASHPHSKKPSNVLGLSGTCRQNGKRSSETAKLLEALDRQPSAEGFNALGALFAQKEQFPCAVESFKLALRDNPSSWETRYNLALALISLQDFRPAADELQAVIKQKPDFFAAHNALGLAFQSLGELDAAAEELQRALKINPRFVYAASNLAQIYHAQKKYTAEIHYLRQGLAQGPPEDLAYSMQLALGIAYESSGNTDAALEELRKLVAAYPQSAEAHFNLATLYARHVRFKEARPEFEACLRLDPANNAARLSLAKALTEIGDNALAVPVLQEYIRRVPGDYEGSYVLGEVYRKLGEFDKAVAQLQTAAQLAPENYEVQHKLGLALTSSKRLDEAIAHLEKARKLNPQAPEIPYELAAAYQRKGEAKRAQEALSAFEQAKQGSQAEEKASQLGAKANSLLEQGDAQGAAQAYREL